MTKPTINDIIGFINKHRKGKAFDGYTQTDIYTEVYLASIRNLIGVATVDSTIVGIAIACKPQLDNNELYIRNLLTTKRCALPMLVNTLRRFYPNHTLKALRRGRQVTYNTPRLLNKLSAL